jgi:hypothetical protein
MVDEWMSGLLGGGKGQKVKRTQRRRWEQHGGNEVASARPGGKVSFKTAVEK